MARVCNFQMFQHILFLKDRVSILCKANFIVKLDYKEKPSKIINFERYKCLSECISRQSKLCLTFKCTFKF